MDVETGLGMYNLAASTIQSIGNNISAYQAMDADRDFSREMYERQRVDALSDWHLQNVYNSPKSIVRRLAEAGLNPNLFYGSSSASTPAVMPRQSSAVNMNGTRTPQFNVDFAAAASLMSQIKVNESIANKNNAEADKALSETKGIDWQNKFNVETEQLQKDLMSHNNALLLNRYREIDHAIINGDLITQRDLNVSDEQIKTMIQSRFVQWEELDLTRQQIGANIRQGYMHAQAAIMQGKAAQTNGYANLLRANSDVIRNSKLNALTDRQIGSMALEYRRLSIDMQYDSERHENESYRREQYLKTRQSWDKRFGWTGLSFDDFRSLIPFAPSVEGGYQDNKNGSSVKWKF